MNKKEFLKLLHRRMDGSATDREKELLDSIYDQLQQQELNPSDEIFDDVTETESRILGRIKQSAETSQSSILSKPSWWLKAAACVILLAGISIVPYLLLRKKPSLPAVTSWVKKTTLPGQVKKIVLPDSSLVWLNGESTLVFPSAFMGNSREITLEGEAFFEVARSSKYPFIVHTGDLETKVLGTSFNIKAFGAESESSVTVVTGKVGVYPAGNMNLSRGEGNGDMIILSENESAYFNKKSKGITKREISIATLFTGQEKRLSYLNVPLWQVAKDIESVYNIRINLKGSIKNCPVYGDFNGKTVEEIMNILSFSIKASFRKSGNTFYLDGKGCN